MSLPLPEIWIPHFLFWEKAYSAGGLSSPFPSYLYMIYKTHINIYNFITKLYRFIEENVEDMGVKAKILNHL